MIYFLVPWLCKNKVIFYNIRPYSNLVINNVKASFHLLEHRIFLGLKHRPIFCSVWPVGFFDGAKLLENVVCWVREILHLSIDHLYYLRLGRGYGTNNNVEHLSLWCILTFAKDRGIAKH